MNIAIRSLAWGMALTAIGVCGPGLLAAALPRHRRAGVRRGLIVCVGLCLGILLWAAVGLTGFFIHKTTLPALMAGDAMLVVLGGLAIVWCSRDRDSVVVLAAEPETSDRVSRAMLCLLIFAILASVAIFLLQVRQRPDGGFDAWAIWNLRARFIYAASDHTFDATFAHADYSPLWPGLIARIDWLLGWPSTVVQIVCAALMAVLTTGGLLLGVAWFRGLRAGVFAAIILLGTQEFIVHAADQYADVPLACVFLSAGLVLAIALDVRSTRRIRLMIIAGALAGLGALVKNEGMLYLLGLLTGLTARTLKFPRLGRPRAVAALVAGAAPILLLLGVFKMAFAPSNDLISGGAAFAVAHESDSAASGNVALENPATGREAIVRKAPGLGGRVTDIRRYRTIIAEIVKRFVRIDRWNIFLLACVLAFFLRPGTTRDSAARTALGIAVGVTCAGYFAAYVTTPHGLLWHINTSMNRLILQIWAILLFLLSLRWSENAGDVPFPGNPGKRYGQGFWVTALKDSHPSRLPEYPEKQQEIGAA